MNKVT